MRDSLAVVGNLVSSNPAVAGSKAQLPMLRAGYRSASAIQAMQGMQILMPIAFVVLVFATGMYHLNVYLVPLLCAPP